METLVFGLLFLLGPVRQAPAQQGQPPAGVVLPNGRHLSPAGEWFKTAPYPFAIAVRPGGAQLAIPSVGWPFSLNILDRSGEGNGLRARHFELAAQKQIPPGAKNSKTVEVINGVAYSADGSLLYVSTGDTGAVDVYATATWEKTRRLALDGGSYRQSFSGALALSPDGQRLFVLDQANWRVVCFSAASGEQLGSAPTGADPFALALDPAGKRLYVANAGLFAYKLVSGLDPKDLLGTGLRFPPTAYPSEQARTGTVVDGHAIPALGEENSDQGSSVWTYEVADAPRLSARLRLGAHIDPEQHQHAVVGGAAPMGLAVDSRAVYVSLAHQDAVAVLRLDGTAQLAEIPLSPFTDADLHTPNARALRGVMPGGLAVCNGTLYVAEAGIDAVGVVDTRRMRVEGHVPVGWYPSAVACAPGGAALYVVNTKGQGSGPNGGANYHGPSDGTYIAAREFGSLSVLPLPARVGEGTATVVQNNLAALGSSAGRLPRLKHVFLIIRENRTFDEILGDLPGAEGDPALARWGMHGWTVAAPGEKTLQVTPNAHALAARFATSDRFFVDSDVSADGHRWVVGAAETPWFHLAWTSNYGGRRTADPTSAAPGRRAIFGGNDSPMPEDEPEFGTLWEHIANAGLTIRNYGEGIEVEGADELDGAEPEGQRLVLNAPVPRPIFVSSDRAFPTFNLGIPDQFRFEEFARDFNRVLSSGQVPSLVVIRLPNDHTARPRPADGYPDTSSYVADNDLALGKIVQLVSHSAIWPDTAMLVVEDDAQGGVDHVDAHRSPMFAISPWVRPGMVSHQHTSMGSLEKTAYELLGLPPLNLEDALAPDLSGMFMATPDLRPYDAVPSDTRIFDPARARLARPKTAAAARELQDMDDPAELSRPRRTPAPAR